MGVGMKNRVYCSECKYLKIVEHKLSAGYQPTEYRCNKNVTYTEDFFKMYIYHGNCMVINKNNDCPDFKVKTSLIKKIMGILK